MISSDPGVSAVRPVPGAGGVVLRGAATSSSGPEVLLVRYRSGAWAFPKGHIEAGERPEQTAVREVQEETGVAAQILGPLSATRYTNDRGEAREITWFLMAATITASAGTGSAALEDTFSEGGFVELSAAHTRLSYAGDRALLDEALDQYAALAQYAAPTQYGEG
jgi:diadenosine hexaphosphate hydrolase (ATP-forming)